MRRLALAAASALLAACTAPPNQGPSGPTLVIDVRNASERELEVGYEFTSGATSGSGEGLVAACQRYPISTGPVGGTYAIRVDGKTVVEASVPASAPDGASVVVSVLVGPDGEVESQPPALVRTPNLDTSTVPGCG